MSNKFFKGLRKVSMVVYATAILTLSGVFSVSVFAAAPPAGGGGMEFFTSAIDTLKTLVIALGAGLAVWGVINLLEGYGNDNPGAKSQGMKQLMAGAGVALVGIMLIPLLSGLFA